MLFGKTPTRRFRSLPKKVFSRPIKMALRLTQLFSQNVVFYMTAGMLVGSSESGQKCLTLFGTQQITFTFVIVQF